MVHGGGVSGRVTAAAGGGPLIGAQVCAYEDEGGESYGCGETGANGQYEVTGLAEGHYIVQFYDFQYEPRYYDEAATPAAATKVPVETEVVTPGIDAALLLAPIPPENTVHPAINGTIAVGSTVSCSPGVWSGTQPIVLTYRWLRELVPIEGAVGTTYTIQPADAGHVLWCEVVGTNSAGRFWIRVGYRVPVPSPAPEGPPPSHEVLPAKTVVPAITALGRATIAGAKATLKLRCALGPCHGTLRLLGRIARRVKVHGHTVTRHTTVVLGSGSFSLAQGATGKVTIHLTATGRRLLATARRHPRSETLEIVLSHGATSKHSLLVG
jgi:hypothetical protein